MDAQPPAGPSWRWSISEAAAALEGGHVNAVDLVADALDRIAALDGYIHAFVDVCAERAADAAAASTMRRQRHQALGPLDGIPIAVKDLYHVPGVPTTMGSPHLRRSVPAAASTLVQRLEAAGCIIIGKTNLCEFAHKTTTDNRVLGPTSTPFAPGSLNAGGSSGGSAAAVAAMMTPGALGSDGAGSIRIPAALCGVVGLKPTFGRVPNNPRPDGFRAAQLFASGGPITRSVGDSALLLDALAGSDPSDPFSLERSAELVAVGCRRGVQGLRVGFSPTFGGFPVDAEVVGVVEMIAATLQDLGCQVDLSDFKLPAPHGELCQLVRRAIGDGLDDTLAGLAQSGSFPPGLEGLELSTVGLVEQARSTGRLERQCHAHLRTRLLDEVGRALAGVDVLIGPVSCVRAVPNGPAGLTVGPSVVAGEAVDPLIGWSATWPWNLTGHPAVSVPGALVKGTPVAVQIVGHRHADALVLAVAAALEDANPWRHWYDHLPLEDLYKCTI